MTTTLAPNERTARTLFAPIASNYDRWSALLSMGQDPRWRAQMVEHLNASPGARVLDVAAGTGLITRLLEARSHQTVSLDLSAEMLAMAHRRGATAVLATAEHLPIAVAVIRDASEAFTELRDLRKRLAEAEARAGTPPPATS